MDGSPQTFSQGGNPKPYVPKAQPWADASFQSLINSLIGTTGSSNAQQAGDLAFAGAPNIYGMGENLMTAGYDPQSALRERTEQRLIDQTNAANAMSGVGNTPYGASVMANALGNFDIDWENNALNRMGRAASIAGPLFQAAPTTAMAVPREALGDLAQYMGLGQNASQLAGQLGQMGFNQTASGVGGLLSGVGSLISPIGGLFS